MPHALYYPLYLCRIYRTGVKARGILLMKNIQRPAGWVTLSPTIRQGRDLGVLASPSRYTVMLVTVLPAGCANFFGMNYHKLLFADFCILPRCTGTWSDTKHNAG